MASQGPLYLGFDLSTQQLKGLAVTSDLKVVHEAKFDFDADSIGFKIKNGVLTNEAEQEVYAPVAMWLQALDKVLQRLKDKGTDFQRVKAISGAGQQHGSVYWAKQGEQVLQSLDKSRSLEEQLEGAFSYPYSPNWQDASTQKECDIFDKYLGDAEKLALNTGSKAHHVRLYPVSPAVRVLIPSSASQGHKSCGFGISTQQHIRKPLASLWSRPSLLLSSSERSHPLIFPMSVV